MVGAKLSKPKGWTQLLKGAAATTEPAPTEPAPAPPTSTTKAAEESPEQALYRKGFRNDVVIYELKGNKEKLYKITSISQGIVRAEESLGLSERAPQTVTIEWLKVLEFWRVSAAKVEAHVDYIHTKNNMFAVSNRRVIDEEKVTIFNALLALQKRRESDMSPPRVLQQSKEPPLGRIRQRHW